MFEFAYAGIAARGEPGQIQFSGSFSKSAAPSGGIVTSDTITLTVAGDNDGILSVTGQMDIGTVTLEFRRNAGAYTGGIPVGAAVNNDTMNARITNATAGESTTFSLADSSGRIVGGPYTIAAT